MQVKINSEIPPPIRCTDISEGVFYTGLYLTTERFIFVNLNGMTYYVSETGRLAHWSTDVVDDIKDIQLVKEAVFRV